MISDVHLDVTPACTVLTYLPVQPEDKESVLLFAGDIGGWPELYASGYDVELFFNTISNQFKYVCYVPGNHEAYGGCLEDVIEEIRGYLKQWPNIILLDNEVFEIDDCVVLGTTLWSDFEKGRYQSMRASQQYMNDYYLITRRNGKGLEEYLKPEHVYEMHKNNVEFLKHQLCKYWALGDKKIVVMTHHAPSYLSVSTDYVGSSVNGAYASSQEDLMDLYKPILWQHGHMHGHKDYMIYDTRIVCNPFGYHPRERLDFKFYCYMDI